MKASGVRRATRASCLLRVPRFVSVRHGHRPVLRRLALWRVFIPPGQLGLRKLRIIRDVRTFKCVSTWLAEQAQRRQVTPLRLAHQPGLWKRSRLHLPVLKYESQGSATCRYSVQITELTSRRWSWP